MKQTSHKKGGAWGSRLLIAAALLASVWAGLLASPPATAQSVPPLYGPEDPYQDPLTGCPWWDYAECAHARGFDTANPTVSPTATASPTASTTATPSASPTASASPTPTATSTTSPAAKDQYKEVPDTAAASPTPTASPTATTTTQSLPETSGFSAATLITLGAILVLVGGGFAAWRLYKG